MHIPIAALMTNFFFIEYSSDIRSKEVRKTAEPAASLNKRIIGFLHKTTNPARFLFFAQIQAGKKSAYAEPGEEACNILCTA
jgi:hypothetical protein